MSLTSPSAKQVSILLFSQLFNATDVGREIVQAVNRSAQYAGKILTLVGWDLFGIRRYVCGRLLEDYSVPRLYGPPGPWTGPDWTGVEEELCFREAKNLDLDKDVQWLVELLEFLRSLGSQPDIRSVGLLCGWSGLVVGSVLSAIARVTRQRLEAAPWADMYPVSMRRIRNAENFIRYIIAVMLVFQVFFWFAPALMIRHFITWWGCFFIASVLYAIALVLIAVAIAVYVTGHAVCVYLRLVEPKTRFAHVLVTQYTVTHSNVNMNSWFEGLHWKASFGVFIVSEHKVGSTIVRVAHYVGAGFSGLDCLVLPAHLVWSSDGFCKAMLRQESSCIRMVPAKKHVDALKGGWEVPPGTVLRIAKAERAVVATIYVHEDRSGCTPEDFAVLKCENAGALFGCTKTVDLELCTFYPCAQSCMWEEMTGVQVGFKPLVAPTNLSPDPLMPGLVVSSAGSKPGMSGCLIIGKANNKIYAMSLGIQHILSPCRSYTVRSVAVAMHGGQILQNLDALGMVCGTKIKWSDQNKRPIPISRMAYESALRLAHKDVIENPTIYQFKLDSLDSLTPGGNSGGAEIHARRPGRGAQADLAKFAHRMARRITARTESSYNSSYAGSERAETVDTYEYDIDEMLDDDDLSWYQKWEEKNLESQIMDEEYNEMVFGGHRERVFEGHAMEVEAKISSLEQTLALQSALLEQLLVHEPAQVVVVDPPPVKPEPDLKTWIGKFPMPVEMIPEAHSLPVPVFSETLPADEPPPSPLPPPEAEAELESEVEVEEDGANRLVGVPPVGQMVFREGGCAPLLDIVRARVAPELSTQVTQAHAAVAAFLGSAGVPLQEKPAKAPVQALTPAMQLAAATGIPPPEPPEVLEDPFKPVETKSSKRRAAAAKKKAAADAEEKPAVLPPLEAYRLALAKKPCKFTDCRDNSCPMKHPPCALGNDCTYVSCNREHPPERAQKPKSFFTHIRPKRESAPSAVSPKPPAIEGPETLQDSPASSSETHGGKNAQLTLYKSLQGKTAQDAWRISYWDEYRIEDGRWDPTVTKFDPEKVKEILEAGWANPEGPRRRHKQVTHSNAFNPRPMPSPSRVWRMDYGLGPAWHNGGPVRPANWIAFYDKWAVDHNVFRDDPSDGPGPVWRCTGWLGIPGDHRDAAISYGEQPMRTLATLAYQFLETEKWMKSLVTPTLAVFEPNSYEVRCLMLHIRVFGAHANLLCTMIDLSNMGLEYEGDTNFHDCLEICQMFEAALRHSVIDCYRPASATRLHSCPHVRERHTCFDGRDGSLEGVIWLDECDEFPTKYPLSLFDPDCSSRQFLCHAASSVPAGIVAEQVKKFESLRAKAVTPTTHTRRGVAINGEVIAASPNYEPVDATCTICQMALAETSAVFCDHCKVVEEVFCRDTQPEASPEVFARLQEVVRTFPAIQDMLAHGRFRAPSQSNLKDLDDFLVHSLDTDIRSGHKSNTKEPSADWLAAAQAAGADCSGYEMPDESVKGVHDSVAANIASRAPPRVVKTYPASLREYIVNSVVNPNVPLARAAEAVEVSQEWASYFGCDVTDTAKSIEALLRSQFSEALHGMDGEKSAGWTGLIFGCKLKKEIKEHEFRLSLVTKCAVERIALLATMPEIAQCSAAQLVKLGIRDPVVPAVKPEPHPNRKIYKNHKDKTGRIVFDRDANGKLIRADHPRWRTIYAQSMVDELVARLIEKAHNKRQVGLYALGASVFTGIGCGSSDDQVRMTKARMFAAASVMPEAAEGEAAEAAANFKVSDDVSAMDWSQDGYMAGIDVTARLATMVSCVPDEHQMDPWKLAGCEHLFWLMVNHGVLLTLSTYLIGTQLWSQLVRGVNDSGVLSTGFKNSHPRAFVAWFLAAFFTCACGDDNMALHRWLGSVAELREFLTLGALMMGLSVRGQEISRVWDGPFEACSKIFQLDASPAYRFMNIVKAVCARTFGGSMSQEQYAGLLFETRHSPEERALWVRFKDEARARGLISFEDADPAPVIERDPDDCGEWM